MNVWTPVSACRTDCAESPSHPVDGVLRRRRWVRLIATLAGVTLRLPVTALAGERTQQRLAVCSAARVLTALGVRVDVVNPSTPWPRTGVGRLIVSNHISWLDSLALLTAVRGTPVAKAEIGNWPLVGRLGRRIGVILIERDRLRTVAGSVAEAVDQLRDGRSLLVHPEGTTSCGVELGRFRRAFFQAAIDAGAPVCPVAIRYCIDGGPATTLAGYLGGDSLRRSISRIVAARSLVVEVHLLPTLEAGNGDRRTLAALAENAVAEVVEARQPVTSAHPVQSPVPALVPVRSPDHIPTQRPESGGLGTRHGVLDVA